MSRPYKINISFSSNDGYAEHLCVAIYSLLKNLANDYFATIYILDGGISEKNKEMIEKVVNKVGNGKAIFILMNRDKFNGRNVKGLSQEAYYRLDLPELLQNIDKILYLDVDLIISGDISGLFQIDIKDKIAGAVREITTINYYQDDHKIKSPHKLFFNSGVLLLDLNKLRKIGFKSKTLNCIQKNNEQLKAYDQDVLNIILIHDWLSLHPKYNALPFLRATKKGKYLGYSELEFQEAKNYPIIVHFAGEKPWKRGCFHPLAYLYHQYREEVGLPPISFNRGLSLKEHTKQKIAKITLFLQANLPNSLYRNLIYKPYRFLFRIK